MGIYTWPILHFWTCLPHNIPASVFFASLDFIASIDETADPSTLATPRQNVLTQGLSHLC
jgi:hypothetical protein